MMIEFLTPYMEYIIAIVILIVFILIAKLSYFILKRYVSKIVAETKTRLDNLLLSALKRPIYYIIILVGVYFSLSSLNFLGYADLAKTTFLILGVVLAIFVTVRVVNTLITYYATKAVTRAQRTALFSIKNIINIFIFVLAFLILLNQLDIEITPLIAGLGIGGLAIALALQSTLSNYFAGLYITTDRSIKIGDYIELENGLKGYVEKIGWRSTKVRTLPNNLVIVANSKLAEMIVTNYYDPTEEMNVILKCGVSYDSDLKKVEKVTVETAKKVLKTVEGGVKDFEPFIFYNTFGDSNIEFSIILRVQNFVAQYKITHEFIKELMHAYRKNKIEIAYPWRNIFIRGGKIR